ncbi:MAG: murein biosynthesis integral membrane protein MurJ [Anaerovoracaceae bacterium]|jgi:putative peptidoglycan lipid II flippase
MRTAAQTAVLMSILTLGSKLIGFIREMVMSNYFGTSYVTDAYVMAFTILSVLFGGIITAISTAYLPVFSRISESEGKLEGDRFTSEIVNILLAISVVISLIGIFFSDQIIAVFASGFQGETAKLASFFVKVLFSYVIFSSTAAILEAYLQYKGTFLPQIISGYFVSMCTIVAIIISAYTSYYYLAFGMVIGYILRLITMTIIARSRDYKYTLTFRYINNVREIAFLAIPTFIGSYMQYINQFVDKTLASRLVEGSISALNYASLLNNVIIDITITILATIIYPKLTQANSLKQYDRFNELVYKGFNVVVIISLPFSLGAMVYSNQVVQIIYERGAFDITATAMTSSAFFYYSIGLLFMANSSLLTKVYYSMRDMKRPMIFAGTGVIINIVLNLILVQYMAHNGLALATSIAAFINLFLLWTGIRRQYKHVRIIESKSKIIKIIISAIAAVGSSYIVYSLFILPLSYIIVMRTVQLCLAVIVAILIYLILLKFFKIKELELLRALFSRVSYKGNNRD